MKVESHDILVDQDGEFIIINGDLSFGYANDELLYSLIDSVTGDYKLRPDIGINLKSYINSNANNAVYELRKNITTHMKNDGFKTNTLKIGFKEDKLDINTNFERSKV